MSDLGSGWYLDRIEVMGPEGAVWRFPCHNWLGKSDAGDHRGARPRGTLCFEGLGYPTASPRCGDGPGGRGVAFPLPQVARQERRQRPPRRAPPWHAVDKVLGLGYPTALGFTLFCRLLLGADGTAIVLAAWS